MSASFETQLARVKDEIRAEAEAIRRQLPVDRAPGPSAVAATPVGVVAAETGGSRSRLEYSINELCLENYATFVERAFEALVKREVEPDTRSALVRRLAAGTSKIEILGDLRYSPEGRSAGTRIDGLRPAYLLAKLFNLPVIGYVAEWCFRIARLPIQARQQRSMETYQAGRQHELHVAIRDLERRCEALREGQAAIAAQIAAITGAEDAGNLHEAQRQLGAQIEALSRRLAQSVDRQTGELREATQLQDSRIDELAAHIDGMALRVKDGNEDYHRLVLGMNHWLTSLRTNLAALESAPGTPPHGSN